MYLFFAAIMKFLSYFCPHFHLFFLNVEKNALNMSAIIQKCMPLKILLAKSFYCELEISRAFFQLKNDSILVKSLYEVSPIPKSIFQIISK